MSASPIEEVTVESALESSYVQIQLKCYRQCIEFITVDLALHDECVQTQRKG